jgi:hypothetical protein
MNPETLTVGEQFSVRLVFNPRSHKRRVLVARLAVTAALVFGPIGVEAQLSNSTNDLITAMLVNENFEASHRSHYMYLSKEKSDRTNGHLWTEKVVETTFGKLRMLIAEDGKPLAKDRAAAEKARLGEIAAHPDKFQRQELGRKSDEDHAKEMLNLLPKAFLFENERLEGEFVRIDFIPNPSYQPQSMEEKILHEVVGSMLLDRKDARLHLLEGHLPQDVNIGFGLLATIHAGSNFSTTRSLVPGNEWKTATIDTDINGKALFFKSISRNEHAEHSDFEQVPMDVTLTQAFELLEK